MLQLLKKLFGVKPAPDFKALMQNGALIVDVRTEPEFSSGHIRGAVNIPLNLLPARIMSLKKEHPVITCCASGMRSAQAKSLLQKAGFSEVYNGGGWMGLNSKIS
jgi:rhodanese-related sulfurtransferase